MSATIQTIITCDGSFGGCEGNDWSADQSHETAAAQRMRAKRDRGWRCVRSKDYCPYCWNVLKETGGLPKR